MISFLHFYHKGCLNILLQVLWITRDPSQDLCSSKNKKLWTYMIEWHFDVSRIQCITPEISFDKVIKLTKTSVNINCKVKILKFNFL